MKHYALHSWLELEIGPSKLGEVRGRGTNGRAGPIVVASNLLLLTPVGYGAYTPDVRRLPNRKGRLLESAALGPTPTP